MNELERALQLPEHDIMGQKKNIRHVIYQLKKYNTTDKEQLKEYKLKLVQIDDYVKKIIHLNDTQNNLLLKLLLDISMDEHTAFKGNQKDCNYDIVMKKARNFNRIFRKSRGLPGCYDCGTIGRAVFMTYVNMVSTCVKPTHAKNEYCGGSVVLTKEDINRISKEYSFEHLTSINALNELRRRINKNENNIFICSVGMPGGVGHIWTIESIKNNGYRIYQSSLNEYLLIDSLRYYNYGDNFSNSFDKYKINEFIDKLEILINSNNWYDYQRSVYYDLFFHDPKLKQGENLGFDFMFSSLFV
jgi:hypothetical protein